MRFLDTLCETVVRALGLSALTQWRDPHGSQQPLGGPTLEPDTTLLPNGPRFQLPNSKIICDYSAMKGYRFVGLNQSNTVGSWLEPPNSSLPAYNIHTDYEKMTPQGITRHVCFHDM